MGRGIQPTLKSWRGDPDGRSNTGWGQGAKLACRCWWLRWQVSAGKRSREAKEEASSIQTKQPPNAPVSTCLSTVCPHPASGPPGSASARQTTADVELGTWVPGRGVDAAMRTRTLTSEAQTIPHRSCPLPLFASKLWGAQEEGVHKSVDREEICKVKALSRVRLCDPMDCTRLLCSWDSPGKDTGVDCHFLLQGIFPAQGSNPGLLHCRQTLYHLSHLMVEMKEIWGLVLKSDFTRTRLHLHQVMPGSEASGSQRQPGSRLTGLSCDFPQDAGSANVRHQW